ncbi:hypothetical protein Mapa_000844 [Marchantia paleacea]|nr:hypothetical protein Mapa_000844 [Marchantia paleacea]
MAMAACRATRIAIVGDVHDAWDPVIDARALDLLQPDLVLFTGDFGNKNVDLVSSISTLNFPKAAILGNHDCWFPSGVPNHTRSYKLEPDPIQVQLDLLGNSHVGYNRLDFPQLKISVVGGRPGSWGGLHMHNKTKRFFGATNMDHSSALISKAALGAPEDNFLLLLAHNGPTGLGSKYNDICGKDWELGGGDHGDRDLRNAISQVKKKRKVPLVVFGHMHKGLQYGVSERNMIVVGEDKSVYLNAAVVPRIRKLSSSNADEVSLETKLAESSLHECYESEPLPSQIPSERNFTLVEMEDGELKKISEVWIKVEESQASIGEETQLYPRD